MRNFGNFLGESPGNRLSVSVCNFIAHTNVMPGVQSGENLIEAELAAYLNYVIALNTMYQCIIPLMMIITVVMSCHM